MLRLSFTLFLFAALAFADHNDYSQPDSWLCRPGREDACKVDLTTTIIDATGKFKRETWSPDPNAPIDCFYVYPTVSLDPTGNSDMIPGPEEKRVVLHQLARFASKCRVYAPMYRQITLTALRAMLTGKPIPVDRALAYNDVLDAWNHYLQHDNQNRGVVLIGHSQGSGVLIQLIRNEIDGKPVQSRLVSALLLGANLAVPAGEDAGGAFRHIPLCRSPKQTGCAISYVTFRATSPPPPNSRFGRVPDKGMQAACTNPASLAGGSGELKAYLGAGGRGVASAGAEPKPWVTPPQPVETSFVAVPGMLTAACVSDEHGSYLAISIHHKSSSPRTDDIPGDVVVNGQRQPDWGLHLIDANIAMGNLIDIVGRQSKAYLARHPSH